MNDDFVDLLQQGGIDMAHVVSDRSVVKVLAFVEVREAHDLTHQAVVVGNVFDPVVVASEAQSDDSEHEDVPEIHPRAAGLLLISNNLAFDFLTDLGSFENSLQPGEN
jgi:hypothetical protein